MLNIRVIFTIKKSRAHDSEAKKNGEKENKRKIRHNSGSPQDQVCHGTARKWKEQYVQPRFQDIVMKNTLVQGLDFWVEF